jgi:hypothetical protein
MYTKFISLVHIRKYVTEPFDGTDTDYRVITKCQNKSLNDRYKMGDIEKQPFQIACVSEDVRGRDFYKKYAPKTNMYTGEITQEAIGSNYMEFETYSDPNKLDFMLYDKNETSKDDVDFPKSVNYFN